MHRHHIYFQEIRGPNTFFSLVFPDSHAPCAPAVGGGAHTPNILFLSTFSAFKFMFIFESIATAGASVGRHLFSSYSRAHGQRSPSTSGMGEGRGERSSSVRLTWGPRDPDARFRVQLCHGWLVTGGASRIVSLSPSFPTCQNLFPESLLRLKETIYMKCPFPGFTSRWPYTTEINSSFK